MFYLKIPYLNLDKTYQCEQSSQWYRLREGKYCIVDGEHYVTVEQGYNGMFGFGCNEDEFYNYWYKYFAVDVDYLEQTYKIRNLGDSLKRVSVRAQGIRILKQQLNTVIVQEVFRQNILEKNTLSICMSLFAQGAGNKHKNSIRGAGTYTWYDIPDDTQALLMRFKKIVKIFKENIPSKNKKPIVRTLKAIKAIMSDMVWYDFDNMDFEEFTDTFMTYGLEYETCQRIWMYGLHHQDVFVIDDEVEDAVRNVDDWDEYDSAEEFVDWTIGANNLMKSAGLLNQLIRWDLKYPPRPGDEILWEG